MTTRTYSLVGDNNVATNIAHFIIAAGVCVTIFSAFALLRTAVFLPSSVALAEPQANTEVKPPAGLYERSQPADPAWEIPTPMPTISAPAGYSEFEVPQAEGTAHQANSDLDALWQQRDSGRKPPDTTVPGCAPCAEPLQSGFSTGSVTIDKASIDAYAQQQGIRIGQHVGNWGTDGYTTSSGMRSGK